MPDTIPNHMDEKDIERLLEKYRKGEHLSTAERRWLDSFYLYQAKRSSNEIDEEVLQHNLAKIAVQIKKATYPRSRIKKLYTWGAVAAAILAILSVAYYFQAPVNNHDQELYVSNGQLRQLVLDDGTKITLNAASKITYPKSFNKAKQREVTLIGEAYFDVAKDTKKPFLIHTPRMEIRVLGTAFNVRDYQNEKNAETSLIRGQVEIWNAGEETKKFILKPQEKFVIAANESLSKAPNKTADVTGSKNVSTTIQPFRISTENGSAQETEWMLKRITIKEESLAQIAQRLERMYGVEIRINSPSVADQTYSATFDNERIEDVLKGLQMVAPFRYQKSGNNRIDIYQ